MLNWRKSSYSGGQGNCVEVGTTAAGRCAGIRDSKSPERGHLAVRPAMLGALIEDVKAGRYDLARLAHPTGASSERLIKLLCVVAPTMAGATTHKNRNRAECRGGAGIRGG